MEDMEGSRFLVHCSPLRIAQMRISTKFGHTKNSGVSRKIKSKYFLIFEGKCMEKAYLEGVIEDIDSVCFICDYNKQSFKEDQYDQVLTEYIRRKYKLFITDPLFEFWLLLHFKQVLNFDRSELLDNPKSRIRRKRRFIEKELCDLLPGYKKTDIKFNLPSFTSKCCD